ncbi:MAG: hypothetical protein WD423_07150 [Rhodothermales bacterium]
MKRLKWILTIVFVAAGWVGGPDIAAAQEADRTGRSDAPPEATLNADAADESVRASEDATVEVEIDVDELEEHARRIVVRLGGDDGFRFDRPSRRTIRVPERRAHRIVHRRRSPDANAPSINRLGPPPMAPFLDEDIRLELRDGVGERIRAHRDVTELERESRRLAREVRQSGGDERRELEEQLSAKLDDIFDKKMEIRRDRIQRLESLLEKERSVVEERSQARDEIIDRRFDELLGESDVLDW